MRFRFMGMSLVYGKAAEVYSKATRSHAPEKSGTLYGAREETNSNSC